jgi:2-aminoadipate transaminase
LKTIKPKFFYLIPDFQNPMGTTCSLEKRKRIAELALKYGFLIIEDCPYRKLRYQGEEIPLLSSFLPAEQYILMTSYSKTLAPGLRIGIMMGSEEILGRVKKWATDSYIGPVFPTQAMAYQFFKNGYFESNLEKVRALYKPRLAKTLEILDRSLPTAVYPKPDGGFFIGVTLPEGNDMETLIPRAKEAGINITDGRGFFENPEDGRRFLRIPFCGLKPDEIETAFEALLPLIVK